MNSVLIADDHGLVRMGLEIMVKDIFGSRCRTTCVANGHQLINSLKEGDFDMLITDINMPDVNGVDLIPQVLAIAPQIRILVVSVNPENVYGPRYLRAGAYGYVCKDTDDQETKEAIRCVGMGRRFITDRLSRQFAEAALNKTPENPFDKLSAREFDVALLLIKGFGAIEVGNALSINSSTASSYRSRIFEKLGIKNVMQLVQLAAQFDVARE